MYLDILGLISHISSLTATSFLISGRPAAKVSSLMKFLVMFSLCWPWVRLLSCSLTTPRVICSTTSCIALYLGITPSSSTGSLLMGRSITCTSSSVLVGVLLPLLLPVGGEGHARPPPSSPFLMLGGRMVLKAVRMFSTNCLHSGWSTHSLSPIASSM